MALVGLIGHSKGPRSQGHLVQVHLEYAFNHIIVPFLIYFYLMTPKQSSYSNKKLFHF